MANTQSFSSTTVIDVGSINTRIGNVIHQEEESQLLSNFESAIKIVPSSVSIVNKYGKSRSACPMEQGVITDWVAWEKLLSGHESNDNSSDAPALDSLFLTESPFNTNQMREKMGEICFESFHTRRLAIENTAVTSLRSTVLSDEAEYSLTGVVIDSGYGDTTIVPVYDGMTMIKSAFKIELAGMLIDQLVQQHLNCDATGADEWKKQNCRVALDFECVSPDMRDIYRFCEVMFNPEISDQKKQYAKFFGDLYNVEMDKFNGLGVEVWRSIVQSDSSIREELYENILLCGGNTLFPGLENRLEKEVKQLAPDYVQVVVNKAGDHPFERQHAACIGACKMAQDASFSSWITPEQYQEQGPSILHRQESDL